MKRVIIGTVAAGAAALALGAFAAGTEMLDLDAALAAKVAKEKAKSGAAAKGKAPGDKGAVAGEDECGVNIGNVDSGKPGTVRGIGTPRENTVVITGPVINLGKCKK